MTYSQVYAILPSTGRFQAGYSPEMETWFLAGNIEQDHVMMTVEYGEDRRVMHIDRSIDHGAPQGVLPPPEKVNP